MTLYRSGNYAKAAFGWLLAALLIGYQGFVIIRALVIGIPANWRQITLLAPLLFFGVFFIGIALILNTFLVIRPMSYVLNERRLRAVEQRNPLITPPVKFQPQPELALRDGETLTLERVRGLGSMIRSLLTSLAVAAILIVSGETLIIALLPSLTQSALNPLNDLLSLLLPDGPPPSLTGISPLDWASVALPLIMGGWLVILASLEVARSRRDTLIADDRGVARIRSGRRREFIPWSDVAVFLRGFDNTSDAPQGGYFIWGQAHGMNFQIKGTPVALSGAQPPRVRQERGYRFVGGADAYERDARRLLATISARSYQPMTYWTGGARLLASIQRRFPLASLNLESAQSLPLAVASFQPSETAVDAARQSIAPSFKLKARLKFSWPALLAESLVYFVVLGAIGYIGALPSGSPLTPASIASGDLTSIIVVAILVPFIGAYAVLFPLARREGGLPGVTVTPAGLKGVAGDGQPKKLVEIAWADMRAWVVLPTTPGSKRPTRYIVLSDESKIIWVEPAHARLAGRGVRGDREAAFRERAAELHALIVARTGLPLRDASPSPEGATGASANPVASNWGAAR